MLLFFSSSSSFVSQQIEISVRKLADARLKTKEFGNDHFVCNSCDSNFGTIMNDTDTEINMDAMTQHQQQQQACQLKDDRKQPTTAGKLNPYQGHSFHSYTTLFQFQN